MEERIFSKNIHIEKFVLSYYILCNSSGGFNTYGIGIEKLNEHNMVVEGESISEIFTTEKKAKHVLDRLCRKKVMPKDLTMAVEDMFKQDMNVLHPENHAV